LLAVVQELRFINGDMAGNMRGARGAEVLRVHDLTDVPLERLLGFDGLPAGAGPTVRRE